MFTNFKKKNGIDIQIWSILTLKVIYSCDSGLVYHNSNQ